MNHKYSNNMFSRIITVVFLLFVTNINLFAYNIHEEKDGFKWIAYDQYEYTGVKDLSNRTIVPPEYVKVRYFPANGVFMATKPNGYIGLYKRSGELIYPPIRFVDAYPAQQTKDSPFIVKGEFYGLISQSGNVILNDENHSLQVIRGCDNNFYVRLNKFGSIGYANLNGKILITPNKYEIIEVNFEEDQSVSFSCTELGVGCDLLNNQGKLVFNTPYFSVKPKGKGVNKFYEFISGQSSGILDQNGKVKSVNKKAPTSIIESTTIDGEIYNICRTDENKYYVSKSNGEVVVPPVYDLIKPGDTKNFIVWDKSHMGLVDNNGNILFKPKPEFRLVSYSKDYISAWTEKNQMAIYNKNDMEIYPPVHRSVALKFLNHGDKIDTLILYSDNYRVWGVKDISDNIIIPPIYDDLKFMTSEQANYIVTIKDGKTGLCKLNGEILFEPEYSDFRFCWEKVKPQPYIIVSTGKYEGICDLDGRFLINPEQYEKADIDVFSRRFECEKGGIKYYYSMKGELLGDNSKILERDNYITQADDAFKNSDYKKSIGFYLKAIDIKPDASVYFNCGVAYYNCSNYDNAIDYFQKSLTSNPSDRVRDRSLELIDRSKHALKIKQEARQELASAILGLTIGSISYALSPKQENKSRYNKINNTQSESSTESSNIENDTSSSSNKKKQKCGFCGGKGSTVEYVANYGIDEQPWCDECGKTVTSGHYHRTCTHCNGSGER